MSNVITEIATKTMDILKKHPTLLRAEGLHKLYRLKGSDVHALRGLNLEVRRGEILMIVGPSGAGKSTLLHILGGLDRPTAGSVFFDEIDLYKIGSTRRARIRNRRIGFIFQFYHLLPEFNVLENVSLPRLMKGRERVGKIRKKAAELLYELGLERRMNHNPSEISGGEAQRVAIARALINEPEIVFCDEPTGNLDSRTSEEIKRVLYNLNKRKQTSFVIVTHEPSIRDIASRVLHIKDGKLD